MNSATTVRKRLESTRDASEFAGTDERKNAHGAQAVERALAILVSFASRPEQSLAEISNDLNLPKSTAHRLVAALGRYDLLERANRPGSYRLGPRATNLALASKQGRTADQPLHNALEAVCLETGETVGSSILRDTWAIVIDKIHATHSLMYHTQIGDARPAYACAGGKVLLSGLSNEDLTTQLRTRKLEAFTSNTLTSPKAVERHLDSVRQQGFAVDDEEYMLGLRCVAVPVLDPTGTIRFSMGVSGPTSRLNWERVPEVVDALKRAAAKVAMSLLRESD